MYVSSLSRLDSIIKPYLVKGWCSLHPSGPLPRSSLFFLFSRIRFGTLRSPYPPLVGQGSPSSLLLWVLGHGDVLPLFDSPSRYGSGGLVSRVKQVVESPTTTGVILSKIDPLYFLSPVSAPLLQSLPPSLTCVESH